MGGMLEVESEPDVGSEFSFVVPMDGDEMRCLTSGMDDYLSKPVVPKDLAEVLEKWVRVDDRRRGGASIST